MGDFDRIAISGKMCSGKTTVANMLQHEMDYTRMFFAQEIKILCRDIVNYNKAAAANLEIELRRPLLEIIWNDIQRITKTDEEYSAAIEQLLEIMEDYKHVIYYDLSSDKKTNDIRKMLQQVGTDYMRVNVSDSIWINALQSSIAKAGEVKIIIDDVRYPNEFEMLRKEGFVMIRLNVSREVQLRRLKQLYGLIDESKLRHTSEIAIDHAPFDYVLDSDQSAEELLKDIRLLIGGSL